MGNDLRENAIFFLLKKVRNRYIFGKMILLRC